MGGFAPGMPAAPIQQKGWTETIDTRRQSFFQLQTTHQVVCTHPLWSPSESGTYTILYKALRVLR